MKMEKMLIQMIKIRENFKGYFLIKRVEKKKVKSKKIQNLLKKLSK